LALDGAVTAAGIIVTMMVAIITKGVEAMGRGQATIVADILTGSGIDALIQHITLNKGREGSVLLSRPFSFADGVWYRFRYLCATK